MNYEASYSEDVPLEVRERELKRMLAAIRGYLDQMEAAPMTAHTAVVFVATWATGGQNIVGFGTAEDIQPLLIAFALKAIELDDNAQR
jgi:hypothetical protein